MNPAVRRLPVNWTSQRWCVPVAVTPPPRLGSVRPGRRRVCGWSGTVPSRSLRVR